MPSLGTLFVDLQANTGGFVSALSRAAAEAQRSARDIAREFAHLGEVASQTFGAFGNFNPVISKLSFAMESAGRAASSTMKSLQGFGGVLGPLAALGAGAAVGIAAATIGAIGIAATAAESAAKMFDLAKSTGISASALAAWSFAAKQSGLDQEAVTKSLQILSTNMLKAAQAPAGASNPFKKLGLDIREANGELKKSSDFMLELLRHLSEMRDKTAAVGFARETMGRGGAQMLQLGDPSEIEHWISLFQQLNPNFDANAEAAHRFEQTLGLIRAEAESSANSLMAAMLPTLQYFSDMLAKTDRAGKTWAQSTGESFAFVIKSIATFLDVLIHGFDQIGIFLQFVGGLILGTLELIGSVITALGHLFIFDFSGAEKELAAGVNSFTRTFTDFWKDTKKTWTDGADFINGIWAGVKPPDLAPFEALRFMKTLGKGGPEVPVASAPTAYGKPDVVAEMVGKLQAEAAAALALATAMEKSTAATLLAKAAAEADAKIAETRMRLMEQEKALRGQLADAQRGASGKESGEQAIRIENEISGIHRLLAELEKDAPQIKALYSEIAAAGFGTKASEELEKFRAKTEEETDAANQMAAAYAQGGEAVQRAMEAAKIAPFEKQRADLKALIDGMGQLAAAEAASGTAGPSTTVFSIAQLQKAYDQLGISIERAKASVAEFARAEVAEKIAKEKELLTAEAQAYGLVASAALKSAEVQREASARAATVKFAASKEGLGATPAQLDDVYKNELARLNQERSLTIAQASAQYSLNAAYTQEIEKLQEIRNFLVSEGESTIAIDTKIYETRISHLLDYRRQVFESQNEELLGHQKIYELQVQQTEEWDRAALSVGTLADKFRAMVNEIELEGADAAGKFFEVWKKNIDGLEDTLAKFIVTGKANWKSFIDGIAEQMTKLAIQASISKLFSRIFPPAPGQQGPGQQQTGPGGTPGIAPGPLGIGGAIAGVFGLHLPGAAGKTGGPNGSATSPFYVIQVAGPSPAAGVPGAPGASGGASAGGTSFLGTIAGMFGIKLPGAGPSGAASGAATNTGGPALSAAATALTSAAAQLTAAAAALQSAAASSSAGGAGGGGLFGLFGDSSGGGGGLGDLFSSGAADSSGGFADLSTMFMERGGPVSSGQPYIVGEGRAEVFVPNEAGRIVPSVMEFANSTAARQMSAKFSGVNLSNMARREYGGDVAAGIPYLVGDGGRAEVFMPDSATRSPGGGGGGFGDVHNTTVTMNNYGVKDHDSFDRSRAQTYADMLHLQAIAHQRNR